MAVPTYAGCSKSSADRNFRTCAGLRAIHGQNIWTARRVRTRMSQTTEPWTHDVFYLEQERKSWETNFYICHSHVFIDCYKGWSNRSPAHLDFVVFLQQAFSFKASPLERWRPTFCCFPRSKEARHIYRRYEPIKINERPNGFRDELIHPRPSQLRFVSGLCWTNPNWLERKARAGSPKLAQPMRPSRLVRLQQKNQTVWLTKLPSNKDNHT
jgi:hypothetical protein